MSNFSIDPAIVRNFIVESHGSLKDAAFRATKNGDIALLETVLAVLEAPPLSAHQAFASEGAAKQFIQNERNELGDNLLTLAARSGQVEVLEYLISKGADVNACNPETGTYALRAAVAYPNCVAALLRLGANPNLADAAGGTALMDAVITDDTSTELLLKAGANPNARTKHGVRALIIAAGILDRAHTASLLIEAGADVNAVVEATYSFETPLIAAIRAGSLSIVEHLLEKGADPTLGRKDGTDTPLLIAQACTDNKDERYGCEFFYPAILPIIQKAVAAWPQTSAGAGHAPVALLDKSPKRLAARVRRWTI